MGQAVPPLAGGQVLPTAVEDTGLTIDLSPVAAAERVTE